MFAMTCSQAIVVNMSPSIYDYPSQVQMINDVPGSIFHSISIVDVSPSIYDYPSQVQVINDVSGAIIHSISIADGYIPYPAVCQDDSVIIAWVKRDPGLLSIDQYTKELKYIKNILTNFKITKSNEYFLQAFKTGEIAFCTNDRLYIFHETWM